MDVLFKNQMEEGTLPRTTFTASDANINSTLARSVLTIGDVQQFSKGNVQISSTHTSSTDQNVLKDAVHFRKGTVEMTMYMNSIDGYVYQENDILLCLVPTKNERSIEKIYSNVEEEQAKEVVKKAIFYFDLHKDVTGVGLRTKLATLSHSELEEILNQQVYPALKAPFEQEEIELVDSIDLSHAFAGIERVGTHSPETETEKTGYVFQKGNVVVFVDEQNRVLVNQPEESVRNELIQAMILVEMATNRTGLNIKDSVNKIVNDGPFALGTPETENFIKTIAALDIHFFQTYQLVPASVTVEEVFTVPSRETEGNSVITIIEKPLAEPVKEIITPIIELAEEKLEQEQARGTVEQLSLLDEDESEEVDQSDRLSVLSARIKAAAARGMKLQEIADLTDDGTDKPVSKGTISKVQNMKHGNIKERTLQKIEQALDKLEAGIDPMVFASPPAAVTQEREIKQTGEVSAMTQTQPQVQQQQIMVQPVKLQEKVPTLEEIKEERPFVFDDDAIRAKLYTYDLSAMLPVGAIRTMEDFVETVIEFRRLQREEEVPQDALLDIEKKMAYVGDVEPIFIGLMNMMQGIHVLYTGPAGAGKTVIAQTISTILNMPLYTMNGNVDTDTDVILGSKEASNGSTYSVRGLLVKALENAGIFYGDEVNFILNEILSVMNPALDDRREVHNPNTHEKIIGHKNFRFIGSMNVGYQGTRDLNEATNDRFVCVDVDYMPESALKAYIENFDPGYTDFQKRVLKMDKIPREDVLLIADIARALQQGARNPDLGLPQEAGSIRNINQIIQQSRNLPMHLAVGTVIKKYRDPLEQSAIRGVLQSVDRLDLSQLRLNASDLINM